MTTEWLILLTLAVQTIIVTLVQTDHDLGGSYGLQSITGLHVFGRPLDEPSEIFAPFLVLAVAVYAICRRLGESPYGRVLRAIREDATACRSVGKRVYAYKLTVFALTAAMAGLAGAMLVIENSIASPTMFSFDQSAVIVAMVVIGGAGNVNGSLVGVVLLTLIAPLFDHVFAFGDQAAFVLRLIAYGIVLVAILLVRPQGLFPDVVTRRLARALGRGGAAMQAGASDPADRVSLDIVAKTPVTTARDVVVRAEGLTKRFGGLVAVENLTFSLLRGHVSALVGPNGAGKTTVSIC